MKDVLVAANPSAEPTKYDAEKYGSKVNWSRQCMFIDGKPTVIVSGEFQYWRIPDRSRWKRILLQMKSLGLNTVRFYFHWGYHSPAEDSFISDGSRDIEELLNLCEELQLFVIAAPGPYICAETQGGGFPTWLLAKRNVRIRHLKTHFLKKFDAKLAEYQKIYYRNILAILTKHERTTNPTGCVILMQIENELLHKVPGITFADDEEMRSLASCARDSGSTVPFFHNDDMPHGSWATGKKNHYLRNCWLPSTPQYRTDMYGVDLYFVFAPRDDRADRSSVSVGPFQVGGCAAFLEFFCIGGLGIGGDDLGCIHCLYKSTSAVGERTTPPPNSWNTKSLAGYIDTLEKKLDAIGGAAEGAPVVCAETQVGWINQWARKRDYDDLYDYFGDSFSATLHSSLAAQGLTVINYYTAYGGTNYGASGDSEVYTSYDYSAYIREFGKVSERGRRLRLKALFQRSFAKYGIAESVVDSSLISCSLPNMLLKVRRAARGDGGDSKKPRFIFLRNFASTEKAEKSRLTLAYNDVAFPCELAFKDSLILPANVQLTDGLTMHLSTIPVATRGVVAGAELWVLSLSDHPFGRVLFRVGGDLTSVQVQWTTIDGSLNGSTKVSSSDKNAGESQWKAPLEELSQAELEGGENGSLPVDVSASTEANIGKCVSLAFHGPCATTLLDQNGAVLMRMLAISEQDSKTFTALLDSSSDSYTPSANVGFACAWGAEEICILPSGQVSVEADRDDRTVYYVGSSASPPSPSFVPVASVVQDVLPGAFRLSLLPKIDSVLPAGDGHYLPLKSWNRRRIIWATDVEWKKIDYTTERDPLDHHFTSGYTTYRCTFDASGGAKVSMKLNIRHIAMVYCDGHAVEGQFCYSHNGISAGAMHAVDVTWAGKKRVNLTKYLDPAKASHEVVIAVMSLGQGRQPFLLNDVRNRRGLISASLSRSARNQRWGMYGVPVSSLNDPFNTTGLPLEREAVAASFDTDNPSWDLFAGESPMCLDLKAEDGIQWLRTSFQGPDQSAYRFPLRLKFEARDSVVVCAWVNDLFIGRYLYDFGPQNSFYIMEGVVKSDAENSLVLAVMTLKDTPLHLTLGPWIVDGNSGNLSPSGKPFVLQKAL
eukprot:CAMPEP_0184754706 /NCGR_PEP_ID=MMETSP0315-20130426/44763_1 /TAXON_ID=101924 /ORGANISM="Rhodosorus marinus, Strain UTEX LB 2760" /LENGTH=1107 /DNA_ID=CAMNT_0027234139 /DNA_START=54 /DNA_END=3377 /DNA_ORIENTATION=-